MKINRINYKPDLTQCIEVRQSGVQVPLTNSGHEDINSLYLIHNPCIGIIISGSIKHNESKHENFIFVAHYEGLPDIESDRLSEFSSLTEKLKFIREKISSYLENLFYTFDETMCDLFELRSITITEVQLIGCISTPESRRISNSRGTTEEMNAIQEFFTSFENKVGFSQSMSKGLGINFDFSDTFTFNLLTYPDKGNEKLLTLVEKEKAEQPNILYAVLDQNNEVVIDPTLQQETYDNPPSGPGTPR